MTIEQAKKCIGRAVCYTDPNWEGHTGEYGEITSVNDVFVFVRYGMEINSKATNPAHLKLAVGGVE